MRRMIQILLIAIVVAGCAGVNETRQQLPNLAGYTQHEGEEIWDDVASTGATAALFSGNLQFAAAAAVIDRIGGCAQEKQIANWRVYIKQDDPLAVGVVVVVSHANMTNPALLFECGQSRPESGEGLSPCSNSLEYSTANDTYSVFYAASKQSVCDDFMASFPTTN